MNNTAEVMIWGKRIGIIHQDPQSSYSSFEYDKDFADSGIEVSPLRMPLGKNTYEFPEQAGETFYGMPGLVADSLPDKFGSVVTGHWLKSHGRSLADFTAIDRLCYMGKRGMGALEYVPADTDIPEIDEKINLHEMVRLASAILSGKEKVCLNADDELTYSQLVQMCTSAGGARAKALIAWNE